MYWEEDNLDELYDKERPEEEIKRLNFIIDGLEKEITRLTFENEKLKEENDKLLKNHPAYKHNISAEEIVQMLVQGDSLSKVGRHFGCDKKTIKNRLYRADYTDEDISQLMKGIQVQPSNWVNHIFDYEYR